LAGRRWYCAQCHADYCFDCEAFFGLSDSQEGLGQTAGPAVAVAKKPPSEINEEQEQHGSGVPRQRIAFAVPEVTHDTPPSSSPDGSMSGRTGQAQEQPEGEDEELNRIRREQEAAEWAAQSAVKDLADLNPVREREIDKVAAALSSTSSLSPRGVESGRRSLPQIREEDPAVASVSGGAVEGGGGGRPEGAGGGRGSRRGKRRGEEEGDAGGGASVEGAGALATCPTAMSPRAGDTATSPRYHPSPIVSADMTLADDGANSSSEGIIGVHAHADTDTEQPRGSPGFKEGRGSGSGEKKVWGVRRAVRSFASAWSPKA
jgi:hypothetical protein